MAKCDVCGNDYDKAFTLTAAGRTHTFDSFECASTRWRRPAPTAAARVVGHGVEQCGRIFCCAHCAKKAGASGLKDRA